MRGMMRKNLDFRVKIKNDWETQTGNILNLISLLLYKLKYMLSCWDNMIMSFESCSFGVCDWTWTAGEHFCKLNSYLFYCICLGSDFLEKNDHFHKDNQIKLTEEKKIALEAIGITKSQMLIT